jgi:hypothetical protein
MSVFKKLKQTKSILAKEAKKGATYVSNEVKTISTEIKKEIEEGITDMLIGNAADDEMDKEINKALSKIPDNTDEAPSDKPLKASASQAASDKNVDNVRFQDDQRTSIAKSSLWDDLRLSILIHPNAWRTIIISIICAVIGALLSNVIGALLSNVIHESNGILSHGYIGAIIGLVIGIIIGFIIKIVTSLYTLALENFSDYPLLTLGIVISIICSAIGALMSQDFAGAMVGMVIGIFIGVSIKIIILLFSFISSIF